MGACSDVDTGFALVPGFLMMFKVLGVTAPMLAVSGGVALGELWISWI